MQRVAAHNSSYTQKWTFQRSIEFNRRNCIFRAWGIETATWGKKERWYAYLVWTNYGNKKFYQKFPEHKLYVGFPREKFRQFPVCFLIFNGRHIPSGHDDDIISGGKQGLVKAEKFSDQAFNSVASYGVTRFLGYCYTQSFSSPVVAACDSCKVSRTSPHPLLVNGSISAVISYPFQFPVRLFLHAYRPSSEALKARNYTAKRFLPLALLRLKTCLPDLEAIRTRKPWVLFLLVFVLLVKVFFIVNPLKVIRSCVNHSSIYLSRLNWVINKKR